MIIKTMKSTGLSIALTTAFLVAAGPSAFAQDWQAPARGYDGRINSGRDQLEERRGFNDGLIAGRRDALSRLSFKPSASIRYQLGGYYYRQGFQNGYAQAYSRNANNYQYRNNDQYGRNDYYDRNRQPGYNADNYQYRNNDRNSRNDYYDRNRQPGYYDRWGNFHRY